MCTSVSSGTRVTERDRRTSPHDRPRSHRPQLRTPRRRACARRCARPRRLHRRAVAPRDAHPCAASSRSSSPRPPSGCYPLVPSLLNRIGYPLPLKGPRLHRRGPTSARATGRSTAWAGCGPGSACPPARWRWCCATATPPMPTGPSPSRPASISTLTPQSLHVEMVVTNLAEVAQPVGLGWHPYFPKRAQPPAHRARRALGRRRHRPAGAQIGAARHRRRRRAPGLRQLLRRLARRARIRDERFRCSSASLDRLVVYTAPEKDYFCVEPVSHVSNAIHMADPLAARPAQPRAGREHARLDAARYRGWYEPCRPGPEDAARRRCRRPRCSVNRRSGIHANARSTTATFRASA